MSKSNDELMMDTMYWWGIPTLFRCQNKTEIKDCDIALVGVPHSTGNGTTERNQHLVLGQFEMYQQDFEESI